MKEPIRVLQVVTTMNRGGLETMLMNYYRHIDRTKVQFDFVEHRSERSAYDDEIESLGGRIYRMPTLVPWSSSYHSVWKGFFAEHSEYQIIHVHQDCLSGVILKEAKKAEVPVRIAHSHSSSQDKNLKYFIKMIYKRTIPRYATELFACGADAGRWMFGDHKFEIINNAIDVKKYVYNKAIREEVRKEFHVDENDFVVGLVGRFSLPKNHKFLLRIFSEISEVEAGAKLMLVGDGELRQEIIREIERLKIQDKVILTGIRTDVNRMLQAMDVFVMPSIYEGLSLAIIESQAAGLPCIISDQVPLECAVTDQVQVCTLADTPAEWSITILALKGKKRQVSNQMIIDAGYDIENNAAHLQNYYIMQGKRLGQ